MPYKCGGAINGMLNDEKERRLQSGDDSGWHERVQQLTYEHRDQTSDYCSKDAKFLMFHYSGYALAYCTTCLAKDGAVWNHAPLVVSLPNCQPDEISELGRLTHPGWTRDILSYDRFQAAMTGYRDFIDRFGKAYRYPK